MAYVGVEFIEDGEPGPVGLVHSSWLTPLKKEAFWPPYKTSNAFNKALTTPEEPDQSNWKIFPIKRLFFECDNFEKALKKLKKCEETSDVQSSGSDFESGLARRKRSTTRRFLSDSSDDNEPISKLPRPPLIQKLTIKPRPGGSNSQQILTSASTSTYSDDSNNNTFVGKRISTNIPTHKNAVLKHIEQREHLSASLSQEEDLTLTPTNGNVSNEGKRSINVSANGLEKIFREVRKMREELKEVKGLIKQSKNSCILNLPNDTPVEFPLSTIADLMTLDEYLNQEDKFNDLASYFSTLGGNTTNAQVNKILRFVMSDSLATRYNFAGQRNKKAFGDTKLNSVIIRAILIKFPATTQADIENAVKTWLKHAKQRLQKKQMSTRE